MGLAKQTSISQWFLGGGAGAALCAITSFTVVPSLRTEDERMTAGMMKKATKPKRAGRNLLT